MQGWLIYSEKDAVENRTYIHWFISEAEKQQIELKLIYQHTITIGIANGIYETSIQDKDVNKPDFIIIRTIDPFLQFYFEAQNIPVFNDAKTASMCNDKAYTYVEINKLNVPFVPTFFLTKEQLSITLPLSYPFVLKPTNGRGGQEVFYVDTDEALSKAKLSLTSDQLIAQDANVMLGHDVRVFIIGKKIIAAVLRKNKNDFRANFKLGGDAILYHLSSEEHALITKIVNHFNFGLVGIDFLIGKNGELLFNEIEDVVGSRILSETTSINLLERYVAFIKNTINNNLS